MLLRATARATATATATATAAPECYGYGSGRGQSKGLGFRALEHARAAVHGFSRGMPHERTPTDTLKGTVQSSSHPRTGYVHSFSIREGLQNTVTEQEIDNAISKHEKKSATQQWLKKNKTRPKKEKPLEVTELALQIAGPHRKKPMLRLQFDDGTGLYFRLSPELVKALSRKERQEVVCDVSYFITVEG